MIGRLAARMPLAIILTLVGLIGIFVLAGRLNGPLDWGIQAVDRVFDNLAEQRLRALLGMAVVTLILVVLASIVVIRRTWSAAKRATYLSAWRAAEQQARSGVLHEVRMLEHAHLKNAVTEAQVLLRDVKAASDQGQRDILLNELEHSLNRLRRVVVELHGRVGEASEPGNMTALPIDLERTMVEVTKNFRTLIPHTRIERVGQLRGEVPVRVRAALEMALYNALSNAHAHGKAHSVWVRLEYHLAQIVLIVRDDGVGFDVAKTRKTARGRGLHDLTYIAETHQGTVTITSQPGQGTEICLQLPLARPSLGWASTPNEVDEIQARREEPQAQPPPMFTAPRAQPMPPRSADPVTPAAPATPTRRDPPAKPPWQR
jgi:signal transduction histidine kinase